MLTRCSRACLRFISAACWKMIERGLRRTQSRQCLIASADADLSPSRVRGLAA